MLRTSFHTGILGDRPVLEAVDAVLSAGYDGVELNAETLPWTSAHVTPSTPEQVRRELRRIGAVSSIAAHRAGLASTDEAFRAEAVAWTRDLARLAHDIGCSRIHVIPGDEPEGSQLGAAGGPSDLDAFVASLDAVVTGAARLGVSVGLEPIVNQLVSTTDQALAVLDRVPDLLISFDPSHLQVTTGDVTDAARRLGSRTQIAALKDADGVPSDFRFGHLGRGTVDFVTMVQTLVESGFDGYLVVEHESHLFGDDRPVEVVLPESLRFTHELIAKVQG